MCLPVSITIIIDTQDFCKNSTDNQSVQGPGASKVVLLLFTMIESVPNGPRECDEDQSICIFTVVMTMMLGQSLV